MVIIETAIFTKTIQSLMSEDDYRQLQSALVIRPDMGTLFQVVVGYASCAGGCRGVVREVECE